MQPLENFAESQFVFQVHRVIKIRAQTVLMALTILRHHDDRRLQRRDHVEGEIEENEGKWIKGRAAEEDRVADDPNYEQGQRGDDEFPAASKLGDDIRCAIPKGQVRRLLLVYVTGNPILQYFASAEADAPKLRAFPAQHLNFPERKKGNARAKP